MVPKIIAVANTKGGTGKTTVALQLAAARALQGKKVWFVDGDPQQTASMALTLRDSQPVSVFINCASYSNGTLLGMQVTRQAKLWDTVFIDVGGFDSTTMRMALTVCDLVLIPFQPRTFDSWAISRMSKLIDECTVLRKGVELPAYALINCADPTDSSDNRDAAASLSDFPNIRLLDCSLCRRKAYANSSGLGLGVAEAKVKDAKAISEIDQLMVSLFGEVKTPPAREPKKKTQTPRKTSRAKTTKTSDKKKKEAAE